MTKKEALLKLKVAFRNPNNATHKIKEIRDVYNSIKALRIADNASIDKQLENKINMM